MQERKSSRMRLGSVLLGFLTLVISHFIVGPAQAAGDPQVYKVGFISGITGPVSWIHTAWSKTADMAVKEINDAGGIGGTRMEIIYEDNKCGDPKTALSAMNKLIFIDKIQVCLVSFSAAILAGQPLGAENKVLQINSGGWSPNLLNKPYLFSNKIMGDAMVENLSKAAWEAGHRKVAVLHPNDTAGVYSMKLQQDLWKKFGGNILAAETGPMGTTDFRVHLTKIKNTQPEALFIYFYGVDSGYAIKQARELGLDIPIYGMLWSDQAYKASGEAALGTVYVDDYWNPKEGGPWANRFVENYTKLYGNEAIQPFAVNTYEAIYVIKQLIEIAKKGGGDYYKGEKLQNILLEKRNFESVYGSDLVFRENGGCAKPIGLYQVEKDNGKKLLRVFKSLD